MKSLRAALTLFAKEVRLEFRTRELLTATLVFALIIIVFFSFAFDPTPAESRKYGPGILWIAFFFAGSLMVNPSFAREQINDTLDALRMTPIPSFAILISKMMSNFLFMLIAEAILVPAFVIFYNVSLAGIIGRLMLVLVLGSLGLIIPGTVFSAISAHARMRELLLPVLLLPFLTPVMIAAVSTTMSLFGDTQSLDRTWITFLAGFDIVFLTTSWLLSDFLAEG
jgi:heme exporter protein B